MGIRFDLSTVNWLAYLIEPNSRIPKLGDSWQERETLNTFLQKLSDRFYSSPPNMRYFRGLIEHSDGMGRYLKNYADNIPDDLLKEMRSYLGGRPWTALIIPSGDNRKLDDWLCQEDFLKHIISIKPDDPGLILQLEEPPTKTFSLLDVFPAFKTALNDSASWPGILLWRPNGDSVFLPFGTRQRDNIMMRTNWIFTQLATTLGFDYGLFKSQYLKEFPDIVSRP